MVYSKTLKCRFCDWEIKAWYTNSEGKHINNYNRLLGHVELQHEEEFRKMLEYIGEEEC